MSSSIARLGPCVFSAEECSDGQALQYSDSNGQMHKPTSGINI